MKEIRTNLIPTILFAALVQGCSSVTQVTGIYKPERIVGTLNEKQLLANKLGNTGPNETYVSHSNSGSLQKEFLVTQGYTAASGRRCKEIAEVGVSDRDSSSLTLSVVCQDKLGYWYWPRQIILK